MIIAQQKRKENIAEYILYMWQIEDTLRALKFDIKKIRTLLIDRFDVSNEVKESMVEWYENLIAMMKQEGITERGHIQAVYNLVSDLNDTHKYLLKTPKEGKYQQIYRAVESDIASLRKVQIASNANDIEVSLNFLYGILLLRIKQKEISDETNLTLDKISRMMALLSLKHKAIEDGKMELDI